MGETLQNITLPDNVNFQSGVVISSKFVVDLRPGNESRRIEIGGSWHLQSHRGGTVLSHCVHQAQCTASAVESADIPVVFCIPQLARITMASAVAHRAAPRLVRSAILRGHANVVRVPPDQEGEATVAALAVVAALQRALWAQSNSILAVASLAHCDVDPGLKGINFRNNVAGPTLTLVNHRLVPFAIKLLPPVPRLRQGGTALYSGD
mmetsp:Transcript_39158/g.94061  ORF Transcript_39158/g.94061 Transcript_39158/m.94061 type:complete len:208 (+) Transcript_39158:550-1173(+)